MTGLRVFLISLLLTGTYIISEACAVSMIERYYMFNMGDDEFSREFEKDNTAFWQKYCGKPDNEYWITNNDRIEAARKKGDTNMVRYLQMLGKLDDVVSDINSTWDYPTRQQLANREANLKNIVATATANLNGQNAERWCLLLMRANMLLKRYNDNISIWKNRASRFPDTMLRRMMYNVYANALLNTGHKREAWDIYAEQNDNQSLLWSVRKYTNLAGIKQIYNEDPDAPVLAYLLQFYINSLQDVCDAYEDTGEYDTNYDYGKGDAYAPLPDDIEREMRDFIAFAVNVANSGKTDNPAMWMSAAALVNYFNHNYTEAYSQIQQAMQMKGSEPALKMARRIRLLIYPEVNNVLTQECRQFIADELQWLDNDILQTDNAAAMRARNRILNLGLSKAYQKASDDYTAIALSHMMSKQPMPYSYYYYLGEDYCEPPFDINQDHASNAFNMLFKLDADKIAQYFERAKAPQDQLDQYLFKNLDYSDDYANDLVGTRYLAQGRYANAIPYLEKVSLPFLNSQAIAHYATYRDYHIPAWVGFQTTPDNDEAHMTTNVKLDFCHEMLDLIDRANRNTGDAKHNIEYLMAVNLYQASSDGQCWFLTDYSWTDWNGKWIDDDWVSIPKSDYSSQMAAQMLNKAAATTDPKLKAQVLFAQAYLAPDGWYSSDYNYNLGKWIHTPTRNTESYRAYNNLDLHLRKTGVSIPEISRCDVLKQFRKINRI